MKKLLIGLLALILVLGLGLVGYAADTRIIINGSAVEFTQETGFPYLDQNNRILVPLRVTMEAAGASVGYDSVRQTAIVVRGTERIEVPIGNDYLYHNNLKVPNDTNSVVQNGRTYLPIRSVLEAANFTVAWDQATKSVQANNSDSPAAYSGMDLNTAIYPADSNSQAADGAGMQVHFIDVGQGDSILVQLPNQKNLLIDAGSNGSGEILVNYLQNLKITKLDYLVATHPHEDHIGGMDEIVNTFEIGEVYMPAVSHNTRTFERLQESLETKKLTVKEALAGQSLLEDDDLSITMLAPNSPNYESLNNYSSIIKLVYGDTSFLFTGDAEVESEAEVLAAGYDLQAEVLKVGHHGSYTSTSEEFLQAVNPSYAVISCAEGNDYGHPHQVTLDKLAGVQIYRTDLDGNILFISNGQTLEVSTSK